MATTPAPMPPTPDEELQQMTANDFTPKPVSAKRSMLGLIPGAGAFILSSAHKKAAEEFRQAEEQLNAAGRDFGPIMLKYAQSDPSVSDATGQMALKQMASALQAFGPAGKNRATMLIHDIQRSRAESQSRAQSGPPQPNGSVPTFNPPVGAAPTLGQLAPTPNIPATGGEPQQQPQAGGLPGSGEFTPPELQPAPTSPLNWPAPPAPAISATGTPPAQPITPNVQSNALRFEPAVGGERERAFKEPTLKAEAAAKYNEEFEFQKRRAEAIRQAITNPKTGEMALNPAALATMASWGVQVPYIGGLLKPEHIQTDASRLNPTQKAFYEQVYGKAPEGKITMSVMPLTQEPVAMYPGWVNPQMVTTAAPPGGVPGVGSFNPNTQQVTPVVGAASPGSERQQVFTNAAGGQFYGSAAAAAHGQSGPVIPGAYNPAFAPQTSTHIMPVQTYDAQGRPVTQLERVTSTSQRGGGGTPVAPSNLAPTPGAKPAAGPPQSSAPKQFVRPVSPEQAISNEQKLRQYDTATQAAREVLRDSHLLDSLLQAGKLQLVLNGVTGELSGVMSRGVKLTEEETRLVKNFNTLRESVNLLRGPLGATGFRGPEAFKALQSQAGAGNLLANPEITRATIQQFMKEVSNQAEPIRNALHPSAMAPAPGIQVIVQYSRSTGQYRHSTDGGKTWQAGKPRQ